MAQKSISEQEELRKVFSFFENEDGKINSKEFVLAMKSFGKNPPKEKLLGMIKRIDEDEKGLINFEKFSEFVKEESKSSSISKEDSKKLFQQIDLDHDKWITTAELRSFFNTSQADKLTDQEIHEMILEVDVDGDGKISEEEFDLLLQT